MFDKMQSDCRIVIPVSIMSDLSAFQGYVQFIANPESVGYFFTQSDGEIVICAAKNFHVFSVDYGNTEV